MSLSVETLTQCWFLAGPTAGGKTAASLLLAEQINAEIISLDSMAIYRHMDIGTAKPSVTEQQAVPHHLIDVVDPHVDFSVSEYFELASKAVDEILSRNKTPLFVGGTGLYLKSLLHGAYDGPEADWEIRNQLEQERLVKGNNWLHQQLAVVDPASAAKLHPNDARRIIRAIEVHKLTGKTISEQQTHRARPLHERPKAVIWIHPPRTWLHQRINRRVDIMMDDGLLQETQSLLDLSPPPGTTARQALGYRELIDHIENGTSLEQAVEFIKIGTRQFAKRQHTWFRGIAECQSLIVDGTQTPAELVQLILRAADS